MASPEFDGLHRCMVPRTICRERISAGVREEVRLRLLELSAESDVERRSELLQNFARIPSLPELVQTIDCEDLATEDQRALALDSGKTR